jgi:arylsulfatase A-like enzyme
MVQPMLEADTSSVENVLLVTIDALRADHCGFAGHDGDTTPFLDSVASESAVFEQAFANGPGTPISFSSLFSSTYPLTYGGYERLSTERPALQAYLQREGIRTAGIHSNPYLSRHFGYHRGFDHFDDSFDEDGTTIGRRAMETVRREVGGLLSRSDVAYSVTRRIFTALTSDSKPYVDADETTDKAIEWLSDGASDPFFLWLHYLEPHGPYDPPAEYLSTDISAERRETLNGHLKRGDTDLTERDLRDIRALYDAEIRYVDGALERLFEALAAADLLAETAVVVTADHGEEFLDHGDLGHQPKLYDELLHVPLVVRLPGGDPKRVERPVELMSVAPTVVESLGIPQCKGFEGQSLFGGVDDRPIISEVSNPPAILNVDPRFRRRACRHDGWKLIVDEHTGETELYDIETDPGETVDRSDERNEVVAELRGHLDGYPTRHDDGTVREAASGRRG